MAPAVWPGASSNFFLLLIHVQPEELIVDGLSGHALMSLTLLHHASFSFLCFFIPFFLSSILTNKYFFTILIPLCIFIKVCPFSMLYIRYLSNHLYTLTRFFCLALCFGFDVVGFCREGRYSQGKDALNTESKNPVSNRQFLKLVGMCRYSTGI